MEFLELLESIQEFIPPEFAYISQMIDYWYPYLFLAISAAMCFFGLKIHHIWLTFFFFITGFFIGAMTGIFFLPTWNPYIFIVLGIILGFLLAHFTHKLHKLQMFVLNAFLVFAALPSFLEAFMEPQTALAVSGVTAIVAGIAAMKLKYILVIITTSTMGAAQAMSAILHLLNTDNKMLEIGVATVLAAMGVCLQFWQNHKEEHKHKEHKLQQVKPTIYSRSVTTSESTKENFSEE